MGEREGRRGNQRCIDGLYGRICIGMGMVGMEGGGMYSVYMYDTVYSVVKSP